MNYQNGENMNSLSTIWKAFVDNELDDEARRFWGPDNARKELSKPYREVELLQGRGGKCLLTLMDCALYELCFIKDKPLRFKCLIGLPGVTKDEVYKIADSWNFAIDKADKKMVQFFDISTGEVFTVKRKKATTLFRQMMGLA